MGFVNKSQLTFVLYFISVSYDVWILAYMQKQA
jgi:hypothetical protein